MTIEILFALVLVKFDEHSRSAQTDPAAVALDGVALATLDNDPGVRPDAHAFIVEKALWFTVTDDLPQYPARIPARTLPIIPDRPIARDCGSRRHAERLLVVQ
jgi:hypothetical protein